MEFDGNKDGLRRRIARAAVVALAIGAFGAAGLTGTLAQSDDDSVFDSGASGASGIFADDDFLSEIFGDDFLSEIFADDIFLVDVPTGGSGGNLNLGGSTGGDITIGGGGGSSGGITLSGGNSGSGGSGSGGFVYE